MILIIDNYDSFTYNLVQLIAPEPGGYRVERNDKISIAAIRKMKPDGIVLSPGPGRPENAGICVELIRQAGSEIPILGVCLGHQAIGVAYGGTVGHAPTLMHGKTSPIHHSADGIYTGLPNPFVATRYHSLVIERASLPPVLQQTANTVDNIVMGVRHTVHPVEGIQFHPESILTAVGNDLIKNWLQSLEGRA